MSEIIQVMTTVASQADAERLAQALVERGLAACVQVWGPITSVYRWKDAIEQSEEWLCTAKTLADRYAALEQALRGLHPYETPEILAVPVVAVSASYLEWMRQALAAGTASADSPDAGG